MKAVSLFRERKFKESETYFEKEICDLENKKCLTYNERLDLNILKNIYTTTKHLIKNNNLI